jgi:MATE family multidrug resistance protein
MCFILRKRRNELKCLCLSVLVVTGISIIFGFALGFPPLAAQAFGASNFERCGELLQRQIMIHFFLVLPPVVMMWSFSEKILNLLNQPETISALTSEFLFWRLPALPFIAVAEDLGYFLKAQRVMVPTMVLMLVLNMLSVGLAWLFISPLGLGFKGGPIALTVTNIAQCIILCAFAKRWLVEPQTWPKWSVSTAMAGWREILNVALPAALGMWAEWWAFELIMIFTGLLCDNSQTKGSTILIHNFTQSPETNGDPDEAACVELDVSSIISNILFLVYYFHFGFSVATGTIVGNLLGSGDHFVACLTARVNLLFVAGIGTAVGSTLLIFRRSYGSLFTADPKVQHMLGNIVPLVTLYILADAGLSFPL